MPRSLVATMSGAITHMAVPSSDTSTTDGSPVRSRRKSAAAMPPATAMPPVESPKAARCLAVAAHVDDARVHAAHVLDVDAETPARGGKEVGDEHVRAGDQTMEQL